jgi:hypothetical protein
MTSAPTTRHRAGDVRRQRHTPPKEPTVEILIVLACLACLVFIVRR